MDGWTVFWIAFLGGVSGMCAAGLATLLVVVCLAALPTSRFPRQSEVVTWLGSEEEVPS